MRKTITLILLLLLCIISFKLSVNAESSNLVNIYFFHSNSCSHCKEETKFLEKIIENYPNVKIYKYEIHNKDTNEALKKASDIYNIKTNGVPITIIGNKVYTGFSYEKSSLKFIKTIEYYSKYGYQDKLGEQLNLNLPTYEIKENTISLDKFINEYHNYKLLGIKTDNLTTSVIAIFLGVLSSINIIRLITIILVIIIIKKEPKEVTKLLFSTSYILLEILLILTTLLNDNIFTIITSFIIATLLMLIIHRIIKDKKSLFNFILLIIISVIGVCLANRLDNNIIIFKNILNLHHIGGLEKIMYYSNFIISKLTISIIVIYISGLLIENIKTIKTKK